MKPNSLQKSCQKHSKAQSFEFTTLKETDVDSALENHSPTFGKRISNFKLDRESSFKPKKTGQNLFSDGQLPSNDEPRFISFVSSKEINTPKYAFEAKKNGQLVNFSAFVSKKAEFHPFKPKILEDNEDYDQCNYNFSGEKNIREKNIREKNLKEKKKKIVGENESDKKSSKVMFKKYKTGIYVKPKYNENPEIEGEKIDVSEADDKPWLAKGTLSDLLDYEGDICPLVDLNPGHSGKH
jgi:hypothetical protein